LTERFYRVQLNTHNIDLKKTEGVIPKNVLKCKMLILTSKENHNETVKFFKENNYFGGESELFEFFSQTMLPALDLEGKILMHSPHEIKLAPNGNGGLFDSIAKRENIRNYL
jgi:UDP-N-acetylglucosamine pyrophosphorylase